MERITKLSWKIIFLILLVITLLIPLFHLVTIFVFHAWPLETGYITSIDYSERTPIDKTTTTNWQIIDMNPVDGRMITEGKIEIIDSRSMQVNSGAIITNLRLGRASIVLEDYFGDTCRIPYGMSVEVNDLGLFSPISYNPFVISPSEKINTIKDEIIGTWHWKDDDTYYKFTTNNELFIVVNSQEYKGIYSWIGPYEISSTNDFYTTNEFRDWRPFTIDISDYLENKTVVYEVRLINRELLLAISPKGKGKIIDFIDYVYHALFYPISYEFKLTYAPLNRMMK